MSLSIREVSTRRDRSRFVDFPYRLYRSLPGARWVPQLKRSVRWSLDTRRNAFYRQADLRGFLALRGGRVVGRIAAIGNRAHNEYWGDRVGFFGFFECEDDPEAASALLNSASEALSGWGLEWMRGPVSPSTNHEAGLLVEGFEDPPVMLTAWNPPYYLPLLEGWGLKGEKDLLGFQIPLEERDEEMDRSFRRMAGRARGGGRWRVRELRMDRLEEETELLWEIYSGAWKGNWGFSPISRPELGQMVEELRSVANATEMLVAEKDGRAVGFFLAFPDVNRVLAGHWSGRLFPGGIWRIFRGLPKIRIWRIFALGVREEEHGSAALPILLDEALTRAPQVGARWGEASWILEDNHPTLRTIARAGGREYRRWRIFGRSLLQDSPGGGGVHHDEGGPG